MAAHPYNLRSRVNSPASVRTPGTATPTTKTLLASITKPQHSPFSLQLDHVVGTTAKNPSGLSGCPATETFAYCAGSVAVVASLDRDGTTTHRYYKARPTVLPVNPSASFYTTPTSTPTRRRTALITPRKEQDLYTPGRSVPQDENAKTWTARERIKTIKSVALSPNGRFLAVGESGYNPRVLLFSTAKDASTEIPLSIVTDHTWGVRSVAFSPDSRYLATLGESNDGFLFIWSVTPKTGSLKLCATNKCTTNVCHVTWCGQQLITVGTRHVKVWQLPGSASSSPSKRSRLRDMMQASPTGGPIPLPGRNCLLGSLVDVTFTCAVAVDDHHALVCTDVGSLCLVDVSKTPAELQPLMLDSSPAGAMGFREEPRRLVWAGGGGELHETNVDVLLSPKRVKGVRDEQGPAYLDVPCIKPRRSALRQSLGLSQLDKVGTVAMCCLTKHTISIDAECNLVISKPDSAESLHTLQPLSSHNEPVQGVQALDAHTTLGAFFTWSKNGEIRFWDAEARLLRVERIELDEGSDIEDAASNELKVLRCLNSDRFISGDRYGVLKLFKTDEWRLMHTARAHSAEVNDICTDKHAQYLATCSRDRMVQVFTRTDFGLDLIQTTDDHIAAVNQLAFSSDGNNLLSCSSDRTIVVRDKVSRETGSGLVVAFLQTRIITIKASPLSMCLIPDKDDHLYVSSLDRQVTRIDYQSGTILESFKVADGDSDDHAVLNSIQVATNLDSGITRNLLIGCSSTDKSVRIYDPQKQALVSKESAHTEGVSDIALLGNSLHDLQAKRTFVSTGHDGTIMQWTIVANAQVALTPAIELSQDETNLAHLSDSTPAKPSPATLPPLRKVLTKVDIAEFVATTSPRSPSLRDPSPARGLRRKGSRLALATSAIEETDENTAPALRRRASADDRAKPDRRSPSPPPYATRRQKKTTPRGEVPKDFFTRQAEWLGKSTDSQDSPVVNGVKKQDVPSSRPRLRRPPSVPTDLRSRTMTQERRASTLPTPPSDFGSINMATEQACRMLRSYKKKLQNVGDGLQLDEVIEELESTLAIAKSKARRKSTSTGVAKKVTKEPPPRLKRSATSNTLSPSDRKQSVSTTDSDTNSPRSTSGNSSGSEATEKGQIQHGMASPRTGLGVEGLSVLLERTTLAEA